jgi:hypothetical protein
LTRYATARATSIHVLGYTNVLTFFWHTKKSLGTLLFIGFISLMSMIGGCDSSVEPTERTLWDIIDTSKKVTFSLDAGGFLTPDLTNDTIYYYDVHTTLPYKSTAVQCSLYIKYEFGVMINNRFSTDTNYYFYDTFFPSFNTQTHEVLSTGRPQENTHIMPTNFGRHATSSWDYPYACRLTLYDINKRDSFVVIDSMQNSYPSNRFRGFINTTGTTDSLEDAPDDGDWKGIPEIGLSIKPARPNPNLTGTYIEVTALQPDTIYYSLNTTRNFSLLANSGRFIIDTPKTDTVRLNMINVRDGLYRVYFKIYKNGKTYQTYGDIRKKYM